MSANSFVRDLMPVVREAWPEASRQSRLIVIGHSAFETGWGVAKACRLGHNLFNITRLPSSKLPIIIGGDIEPDGKGGWKKIKQRFAAYPSWKASVEDYLKFIDRERYKPAKLFLEHADLVGFTTALRNGTYFTLPLSKYVKGLKHCVSISTGIADHLKLE